MPSGQVMSSQVITIYARPHGLRLALQFVVAYLDGADQCGDGGVYGRAERQLLLLGGQSAHSGVRTIPIGCTGAVRMQCYAAVHFCAAAVQPQHKLVAQEAPQRVRCGHALHVATTSVLCPSIFEFHQRWKCMYLSSQVGQSAGGFYGVITSCRLCGSPPTHPINNYGHKREAVLPRRWNTR